MTPSWAPDSTKIAFQSDRDQQPETHEIYVMNADGSNQVNLTNSPDSPDRDRRPAWFHDLAP